MSAVGRVWRRAPAWRLCLITAIACTALAAMFPPAQLRGLLPRHTPAPPAVTANTATGAATAGPGAKAAAAQPAFVAAQPASAHFSPLPDGPPLDGLSTQVPAGTLLRSGMIPFAGRQIPLPAGNWKDLVIGQFGGVVPGQLEILGRIENGELTGLLQADAPSPSAGAGGSLGTPSVCYQDNVILREIAAETPSQSPLVHECWVLTESDVTAAANRAKIDEPTRRALNRAQDLGARIPDHMLVLAYTRSSENGWMHVLLFLPAGTDVTAAQSHRIQAWCKRFAADLHLGYDGKSSTAQARDPT